MKKIIFYSRIIKQLMMQDFKNKLSKLIFEAIYIK